MKVEYKPLEITKWKFDPSHAPHHFLGAKRQCEVRNIADPETNKRIGVLFIWIAAVHTTSGKVIDCIAEQVFFSDQLDEITEADAKELFSFSSASFDKELNQRASKGNVFIKSIYEIEDSKVEAIFNYLKEDSVSS